jgi:macrolide transport system ATP-binding/permease protein
MVRHEKPEVPLIELREIRKTYSRDGGPATEVLRGVSMSIHQGEFVAIVGASGSGKSTLMNLLGLLDRPTSGSFLFSGEDTRNLDADQMAYLRRDVFGFVFQNYHLIATESALENVQVPATYTGIPSSERKSKAIALLTKLGLGDRLDHLPRQLSGGQQQRVSIARALINGGKVILADEPTGALDSTSGEEVMALLQELCELGHTIVLITHDREIAARANRIIEVKDGQILSDVSAPHAERKCLPRLAGELHESSGSRNARRGAFANAAEALRAAWRVLYLNRFRTALTLLGIIMGVGSVIVMLAISLGAREKIMAQMGSMGATIMYVYHGIPPEGGPIGKITLEDIDEISKLPQVSRVMPGLGEPALVRYGNNHLRSYVQGTNELLPSIHHWSLEKGRYFTGTENAQLAPVAVIGVKIAQHFFPEGENPIGKILVLDQAPFEVIGVLSEKGASSGESDEDARLFVPIRSAQTRLWPLMREPEYIIVEAADSSQVKLAEHKIDQILFSRHGRRDYSISNAAAKLETEKETRDTMMAMLALTAAISLLVGGIGVMNVMLMSVNERTREIGIRLATGARRSDIRWQFLIETLLVSSLGGCMGIAIGLGSGWALDAYGIDILFSIRSILLALACAIVTGLMFGFMPARKASRLDPVAALNGE